MRTKDPLGLAQHFALKLLLIFFFFFLSLFVTANFWEYYTNNAQSDTCYVSSRPYFILALSLYMASTALILTLLHSLTLILLLPLSLLLVFFFFFQNLHPHHDPPRKDCRSSEYLEQERRYYKSYSSSSLLYHLFFWLVFTQFCFFFLKQVGTSSSAG